MTGDLSTPTDLICEISSTETECLLKSINKMFSYLETLDRGWIALYPLSQSTLKKIMFTVFHSGFLERQMNRREKKPTQNSLYY